MNAKIESQDRVRDSHVWSYMLSPVLVATLLVTVSLLWSAPPASAEPTITPDSVTAQTDGEVLAILTVDGKTYLGGDFTHVNGVPRARLAAIDADTGELTDWAPQANGPVMALAASASGGRIYAGGSFTQVSGNKREHLAAINAASGTVSKAWKPNTDYAVQAIAVSGNRVYLGGSFTRVNGESRARLARVSAKTGNLSSRWAPRVNNGTVYALALTPDGTSVYAGGNFTSIDERSVAYLAALDATRGRPTQEWHPPQPNGMVWDLELSGGRVYTAEGGPGGAAAAYDASNGARAWRLWADGDVQAIAVLGGKVYFGGHFGTVGGDVGVYDGRTPRDAFAAADEATGNLDPSWAPSGVDGQVWEMTTDRLRSRLQAGGDFTTVSGAPHRGFVQFSG